MEKRLVLIRIISLLVFMVLITAALPKIESLRNSAINLTIPSTSLTNSVRNWPELQKLLAEDGAAYNWFGYSVSLSGDTALIGASCWYNDNPGSAYVFTYNGTTWAQQAKLLASDGGAMSWFGNSVALNGDTVLIGAPCHDVTRGSAYIFTRIGTVWTQQAELLASDGSEGDEFGWSVALSGDAALIGAPQNFGEYYSGAAYVFTRTGTTWTQQAKLIASDGGVNDQLGRSVSLSGDTALIGAYGDDSYKGSAYVFTRSGTTWSQQAKLLASDGATDDWFGDSVALSDDNALIGAYGHYNATGAAYVFTRTSNTWTQQAKLLASDGAAGDRFGYSVALYGDTALIGAIWDEDNGDESGSAYIFMHTGTTWTQQAKLLAGDGNPGDRFGCSVSLSGDTGLIGAYRDDDNGVDSGSAYVFIKGSGNQPPELPAAPTGPSSGREGVKYSFSAVTTDPDGDTISYFFDWGDSENSSWLGPFPSGATATATHAWSAEGTYLVKVKARDVNGAETDWSLSHSISITAAPNLTIEQFRGGLGLSAVVKNIGDATATNITWSINLDGKLIFLGKSTTGTMATIAATGEKPIKSKLIFGFGKTNIVVLATCDEGVSAEVTKTGFVLGPFILEVK